MPTIAFFYGIAIQMFYNDHNPPHFHARYGDAKALIEIATGRIISGGLPPTALRLIEEWRRTRRRELEENWQRARGKKPLEKVRGPDADE